MRLVRPLVLIAAGPAIVLLASASTAAPPDAAEAVAQAIGAGNADSGPFAAGGVVYRQTCGGCHDAGLNRAPQRMVLQSMTPEAIHRSLTGGVMKPFAAGLSSQQKIDVAQYLGGRRLGAGSAQAGRRCTGAAARFDFAEPPPFTGWGLDPASTHSIPASVSGLTPANVSGLKLKWAFGFPDSVRMRSQPTLAGGAILVGNHNASVYALDRATGCVRWSFAARAEVRTGIVVSSWRAGDVRARPVAYFGDLRGGVYAVDARDGRPVWRVQADTHPATIITGTPTLWRGTLYVPVSSNEEAFAANPAYPCCTFRGSIVALDAETGREKWRTWLVDPAKPNGTGEQLGPSGVAVWNSPAIDAARGQLIVATGDNYSEPATPLSDAVVALDLTTGKINWSYQALAGDVWTVACVMKSAVNCPVADAPDFDFGAGVILARAADGRELALAGQKSGWVYGLDPGSGKLVWKSRVGRGGTVGGVHFGMAADAGALFVPISDNHASGSPDKPPSPGLHALDVATGAPRWSNLTADLCGGRPFCNPGYGGSITASGGLVLAGGDDGRLRVYDAASGRIVWQTDTAQAFATVNGVPGRGGSISGGMAPLAYKGTLIVGSGYGYASKMPGNVLLVYSVE